MRPNRLWLYGLLPGVSRRISARPGRRAVYLTFDDGPDPDVTPRVLDLLARHQAQATFFLIGEKVLRYPAVVEQIVAQGHRLGNHSFFHRGFDRLTADAQLAEIYRAEDALGAFDARQPHDRRPHPFRPPHGRASLTLLRKLRQNGFGTVLWSTDSRDYGHDASRSIAIIERTRATDGDIVLLHDDHETVLEVLSFALPRWAAADFMHPAIV